MGAVGRADALDRLAEPKLGPVPTLDLRRSKREDKPPRTERAEQWLGVRSQNAQRLDLVSQLRNSFRALAAEGMALFERGFEAFKAGLEQQREQERREQARRSRESGRGR